MWSGGGQGRLLRAAGAPHLLRGCSAAHLILPLLLSLLYGIGLGDGAGSWKVGGRLFFLLLEISREIIIIIDIL